MEVKRFEASLDYENWVNNLDFSIDIINIIEFNRKLVVTYKRK